MDDDGSSVEFVLCSEEAILASRLRSSMLPCVWLFGRDAVVLVFGGGVRSSDYIR